MFNHIVAGFDGSDVATAAVRWAADEARRRGASLSVVACFTVPVMTDEGISDAVFGVHTLDSLRESTQRRVDEVAVELPHIPSRCQHQRVCCSWPRPRAARRVLRPLRPGRARVERPGSRRCPCLDHWPRADEQVCLSGRARPRCATAARSTRDRGHDRRKPRLACRRRTGLCDAADSLGARLTIVHGWSSPYADKKVVSEAGDIGRVDEATMLDRARRAGGRPDGCGRRRTACRGGRRRQDGRLRVRCRPRRRRGTVAPPAHPDVHAQRRPHRPRHLPGGDRPVAEHMNAGGARP